MKVETPQILWHALEDDGKPAALSSLDILESGVQIIGGNDVHPTYVLATAAGTGTSIHLWKLEFLTTTATTTSTTTETTTAVAAANINGNATLSSSSSSSRQRSMMMFPKSGQGLTKIDFLCALNRHDGVVNQLRFSPDGLHLASCSESGTLILFSVPTQYRANDNGRHFWSTLDANANAVNNNACKITILRNGDGLTSLSWSHDSKRLLLGGIDSQVLVVEQQQQSQSAQPSSNNNTTTAEQPQQADESWKWLARTRPHSHFVQGVAMDPTNVYLASQSSDRTVKIQMRKKQQSRSKSNKFEISVKTKQVKFRYNNDDDDNNNNNDDNNNSTTATTSAANSNNKKNEMTNDDSEHNKKKQNNNNNPSSAGGGRMNNKSYMFCDESTLESFVRRLAWTPDGGFLVCPSAMYQDKYATVLFARHRFEEPYCIFGGLDKPSIAVSVNPCLFELSHGDGKENAMVDRKNCHYRSVVAVLTWDSVFVYDTVSKFPLAIVKKLHYANLVDAAWTPDGRTLLVCSSDGYVSVVHFEESELGKIYQPPKGKEGAAVPSTTAATTTTTQKVVITPPQVPTAMLPPCEPGTATIECPPSKRPKTTTTIAAAAMTTTSDTKTTTKAEKRPASPPTDAVSGLSIDGNNHKKKKKRAQLVSMGSSMQQ